MTDLLNKRINETAIYTLEDLKQDYKSKTNGHWFDKSAMAFFSCRISKTLYYGRELIYFISSEEYQDDRRYTIRSYNPIDGDIDNVGGFQAYTALRNAKYQAQKIAKESYDN